MRNLLDKLVPFAKGDKIAGNPAFTERLNATMAAIRALARGENLASGPGVQMAKGEGMVVIDAGNPQTFTAATHTPLPFEVEIVMAPDDSGGGPRARIHGGWVYQSTSAHGSAKTTLKWIRIPTSYPPEEGGDGPWDTDLADGDNWIYLSNKLLGENPTTMDPPMASWTDTEADTFKGVALAYVSVDITAETQDLFQYHIGNVFVDNNFNLRSSGSLVGYKAELAPDTSETPADLAFKMIAGADPILTLFKGVANLTWNAIKADYIGMITDGAVGPEVAMSRTSGRYTSVKPAYVEMQSDDAAKKVVVDANGATPEVSLTKTSGKYLTLKPAYIESQNDAGTRKVTIEVDTLARIYLLGVNAKLQLEGSTDWLEAGDNMLTMGHGALSASERVRLTSLGELTLGASPLQLTYDPASGVFKVKKTVGYFQADGGALTGLSEDGADVYSLQEITYLDKDGVAKKVKGYFAASTAADSPTIAKRSVTVCVNNVRNSMDVLGTEPA